jgi:hypothetical protein
MSSSAHQLVITKWMLDYLHKIFEDDGQHAILVIGRWQKSTTKSTDGQKWKATSRISISTSQQGL